MAPLGLCTIAKEFVAVLSEIAFHSQEISLCEKDLAIRFRVIIRTTLRFMRPLNKTRHSYSGGPNGKCKKWLNSVGHF
jgi:hypothetical protein